MLKVVLEEKNVALLQLNKAIALSMLNMHRPTLLHNSLKMKVGNKNDESEVKIEGSVNERERERERERDERERERERER